MNCDFTSTFCDRPLRSREDEDEMVASFFKVQSSDEESSPDSFDERYDEKFAFDDELLDHDYPSVPSSRITVYTRDASYDSIYSQHVMPSPTNEVPSRWANSYQQPEHRRQKPTTLEGVQSVPDVMPFHTNDLFFDSGEQREQRHQEQPISFEGVQFVPDVEDVPDVEEDFFSRCCATDGGIDVTQQLSTIVEDETRSHVPEELPADEYNVMLARDDTTMITKNSRRSKQRSVRGPFDVHHRLPSHRRALASTSMAKRQRKLLRSFVIVAVAFIIGASVFAYFVLRDQTEGTEDSPVQQAQDNNLVPSSPTVAPAPTVAPTSAPTAPTRSPSVAPTSAPTIRNVEAILNSETYNIISSKVDDPEVLLDLDTPQGKAFELVYEQYQQDSQGRALVIRPQEDQYRILQRYVLMVLYYGTWGDDLWIFNKGWRDFEDNECDWTGVESCKGDMAVTNITLARTKVMGTLPTELCLLTELQALVLNRNLLSGEIPECLTTMPKLKQLDLRGNDLSGPLPNDFFLSSSLESLDLSRNKLTGSIGTPPAFSVTRNHFPSNLKFKTINLDDNLLSGYIDNIFIYFTGLETLTLHNNNMVGGIDAMCTHPLKELTADCDKITCTCCTQCFNDP